MITTLTFTNLVLVHLPANSLNVVQTTPSIVSVNSAIPLDTMVNSNGTQSHSHHQQLFYLKVEEPIWQSMKCKLLFNQEVIRQV